MSLNDLLFGKPLRSSDEAVINSRGILEALKKVL